MTLNSLRALVVLSLSDPAEAARRVIAFQAPREALWTALFLAAVLNTLIATLSHLVQPVESLMLSPAVHLAITVLFAVSSVFAVHVVGRFFGGNGVFEAVLAVFVWLQILQVLLQAFAFFLSLVFPSLELLVLLISVVLGLYISVHFVDQAQALGSPMKAAGVLIVSSIALAFIMSFLLVLIWGDTIGGLPNV